MIRITIICPEAHVGDANQLAMALGEGPADGQTFGAAVWQDGAGAGHAVASLQVSPGWLAAAGQALVRPVWDTPPYRVNLTGAGRAQQRVTIWNAAADGGPAMPAPDSASIIVIAGLAPDVALASAGLTCAVPPDGA